MGRVCPLLVLAADGRSAVDGFDPDHRCAAEAPPLTLDKARQLQLCLSEEHRSCDRFLAYEAAQAGRRPVRRPAPDARFVSTRLVFDPEPAWRGAGIRTVPAAPAGRLALTGASVVIVLAAGTAAAMTNGFGLVPASAAATPPVTVSSPTPAATPSPTPSVTPAATPTAQPTPTLSPAATPRPATPSPRPTVRTYVVQKGDTLSAIAARFGTTVRAIAAASGIDPNAVLNVGQVLVIP